MELRHASTPREQCIDKFPLPSTSLQKHGNGLLMTLMGVCRGHREALPGRWQKNAASRLVANAASTPDRPQGTAPEQLPFSGGNSPSNTPVGQFPPEEKKPTFFSRVIKPLQDFGFGKMAFMEGGVGLFVFAGIGGHPSLWRNVTLLENFHSAH